MLEPAYFFLKLLLDVFRHSIGPWRLMGMSRICQRLSRDNRKTSLYREPMRTAKSQVIPHCSARQESPAKSAPQPPDPLPYDAPILPCPLRADDDALPLSLTVRPTNGPAARSRPEAFEQMPGFWPPVGSGLQTCREGSRRQSPCIRICG